MKVYIVTMRNEDSYYILGIWTNKIIAENYGITEESYCNGKYEAVTTEWDLDYDETQ